MSFIIELATARGIAAQARKALDTALMQVKPLNPEVHDLFVTKPEMYAKCLRQQADIMDTLPVLRAAVTEAEAALAPVEAKACWKCGGTGRYAGPTNATRRGVPYCFKCDGNGTTGK